MNNYFSIQSNCSANDSTTGRYNKSMHPSTSFYGTNVQSNSNFNPSHHLKPAINEIAVFPAKKLTCFIAKMFKYFHSQNGLTYRMMTLSCLSCDPASSSASSGLNWGSEDLRTDSSPRPELMERTDFGLETVDSGNVHRLRHHPAR